MERELNTIEQDFSRALLDSLPPLVARERVEELTGGLVSSKTLSNMDGRGLGPEEAYRVGRKIAYKRESLVEWMIERYGVERVANLKNL